MAEEKKTTGEKLVELRIPRGRSNEEPCLMIGVNGKNWLLPKGETSKVPEYVAEEYHRSMAAVDEYSAKINNIQDEEQAVNASARAKFGG